MTDGAPFPILVTLVLIASPFVGSFLGLLAMRLPEGRRVIWARSQCDACHTPLTARDLVPLLSWVLNRRRCRHCGAPLSVYYPFMEIAALLVAVAAALSASGWAFVLTCCLGWVLLTLAAADWRAMILPDVLTLPLIPIGLALALASPNVQVTDHLIGAVAGGASLWAVNWLYRRIKGRDGLGLGDVKLFAAAGAWLGWQALPNVLLCASFLALGVVLALGLSGREITRTTALPFGTPLAIAFFLVWLYQLSAQSLPTIAG